MGFEYWFHFGTESKIGKTNHPSGDFSLAILSARTLGGNTLYKFRLTYWLHFPRTGLPIHRFTFQKYSTDDVVASSNIL
jgi:hypothetical protein